MKKVLFSLSLLVVSYFSFSQAKVEVGLKAGANFSNNAYDINSGSVDTDAITAFHGGLYGLVKVGAIGVQPEVLLSKQGSKINNGEDVDLTYLNIPVMIKFYLPLGLNLQAGPQFGVLTEDVKADIDGDDVVDTFKSSDFGLGFGAGIDAPFGLQANIRYIVGLSNISDIQDDALSTEIKNRTFQVSIGYRLFKLGN